MGKVETGAPGHARRLAVRDGGTHLAVLGRSAVAAGAMLTLAACATMEPVEPPPTTASEEAQYAALYPYYAEICALSQLDKKPGFGADISSGFGGHAVLYLNGVCRKKDVSYPILQMCDEATERPTADGVGLSVNAHYQNAMWVATEGREFFFNGGLKSGEALTRDAYQATQAQATAKKIYDGVIFHEDVYDDMPADFTRSSFKYEMSVASDYAIAFGRNRYCARVPLSRPQMVEIVDYLNGLNEPYKDGRENFEWNIFTRNCSHINHNALAVADLWDVWETDRSILISLFDFPVPKNEFVNTIRRTNDLPIDDLEALYHDDAARSLLMHENRLPTQPGALADLGTIVPQNGVYDTQSRIIFYDDPITGTYQRRFDAILSEPGYFRLRDNLVYFAQLYKKIRAERKPLDWYLDPHKTMSAQEQNDFRLFYRKYYDYIDRQVQEVDRNVTLLDAKTR
jgi:hypothetical protein